MSTFTSGGKAGFYRFEQLANRPEVTEEQAARNRAKGRGLVKPRPRTRGLTNVSGPTLWRLIGRDKFPAPVKIGGIAVWSKQAVDEWMAARFEPQLSAAGSVAAHPPPPAPAHPRRNGRFAVRAQVEG
jgi:predicted DNA-binding transcriptional regulator AlpA